MSRNVFISFLGTSDYTHCRYQMEGNKELSSKFVQEAIVTFACADWSENDRILILVTERAKKRNWQELHEALNARKIAPVIEAVGIPDETSEKTIWEIFGIIYNKLLSEDRLLIDITHGFRASPMLLLALIHYASFLKRTQINRIYYGAFNVMSTQKINYAPVWDLTDLVRLHEWTLAANEYINFGRPERISCLAKESAIPYILNGEEKEAARKITKLAAKLCETAELFTSVRSDSLFSGKLPLEVIDAAKKAEKVDFIVPLRPFISEIINKYKGFDENEVLNFLPSVKYCIEHDLIQQGITFLQEGIVSYVLHRAGLQWRTSDESERSQVLGNRQSASTALNQIAHERGGKTDEWKRSPDDSADIIQKIQNDSFSIGISGIYCAISEYRNDINHGGYICPRSSGKFKKKLEVVYEKVLMNINHKNNQV